MAAAALFRCCYPEIMLQRSKRVRQSQCDLSIGNRFYQLGDLPQAASAYAHHVNQHPYDKAGHYNLAVTLAAMCQSEAAMCSYSRALEIDPWYPEALNNLGILFQKQGQLHAAKVCYARALACQPHYDDADYNFATAESNCGNLQNAVLHLSRLLKRSPKRADAWNNLGNALLALNAPADALQAFQFAGSLQPDLPDVSWNSAVAELMLGHLPQGWQSFDQRGMQRHLSLPRWDGSEIKDKSLLVHAEQGFGDTIQFVRYCGQVKTASKAHVILECHPELTSLFRGVAGVDECIPFSADTPLVDYQIPLMSLPFLFRTSLATIPSVIPYLNVDSFLIQQWARQLTAQEPRVLKIGLVWSGNPAHRNDRNRSIPPELLKSLRCPERVAFYSLQQSAVIDHLHSFPFEQVFDKLAFTDTAAILLNLDLLISVDTAAAHLAGALGRPVWTLLPFAADWRWMMNRSDTPWYPDMRLFRQPRLNDWPSVLQQVNGEIEKLLSAAGRFGGPLARPSFTRAF